MVNFCSKCKKILPIEAAFCPICGNQNLLQFCQNCKKIVPNGMRSCPTCGDGDTEARAGTQERVKPKKKKKRFFPVFIVLFLLIGAGITAWWFFFSAVDKVTLDHKVIELIEGETAVIEYEISPKWALPRELKWESSNEDVAEVNQEGEVTAIGKGTCYITLSMKGLKKSCDITVKKDGVDFEEVYKEAGGDGYYCRLATDASYLSVKTNPENPHYEEETEEGLKVLWRVNDVLGLPDSLERKMSRTRAIDGIQTETYGDITVSWTYHPDHGLEVIYEAS